jgi:hypothetical protein
MVVVGISGLMCAKLSVCPDIQKALDMSSLG